MHCSPVSSGGENAYQRMGSYKAAAAAGCKPAADCSAERSARADKPQRSDEGRPARNPLVAAMMEALKGLVAPASPAATDEADSVAPAASADGTLSVKDAAMNFANELYSSLRAAGESAGAAVPKHCGYGHGGGYGSLAQGLQRLAQGVSASAPVTSAPAPAPAAETAPAPQAPAPSVAKAPPPEPPKKLSAPAPAPAPITINISINVGVVSSTAAAPEATATDTTATDDSPLLKAFKDLMAALNPTSKDAVDSATASQRLQAFLQQIARSLGGDAGAQTPEAALPAKGSLINVTA